MPLRCCGGIACTPVRELGSSSRPGWRSTAELYATMTRSRTSHPSTLSGTSGTTRLATRPGTRGWTGVSLAAANVASIAAMHSAADFIRFGGPMAAIAEAPESARESASGT
eukprot:Amastigsp_a845709_13.p2 type:complete len:111 gc:universal Amastigsp_a845709_13:895-563(-)